VPIARYIGSLIMATAITLGIFYIMQALISQSQRDARTTYDGKIIDFVRLRKDSDMELRKRRLPQKQELEQKPSPPKLNLSKAAKPGQDVLGISAPGADFELDLGGPNLGAFEGDSEAVPLVRVQPSYPERAAARGIEGWVMIQFTITAIGSVKDEKVIAYEPSSIFNRAALRAVRKFKYKPKVVDGVAMDQLGQKITISFDLED
jgi:protein TonB